jgi:hypothetical protein
VDLSGADAGDAFAKQAAERGIPLIRISCDDATVRAGWGCDLVLVRPDQHVAWRGTGLPPDVGAVLDRTRAAPLDAGDPR